jgi:hypothetical protein
MRTAPAPGHLVPVYRCLHRPSRRVPAPTTDDPGRELCRSCGATFNGQE